MNLFASNLPLVRKLFEKLWREIARQAGDAKLLDVEAASIEITIKVRPKREMPKHFTPPAVNVKYLRANIGARLFAEKPPKVRTKPGESMWKRLLDDED